uniref:BRCT domain-containing protein n=2 Tax=Clastoptera arizonana TaxID=38151 RepID=A0A1B6DWM4_9HEMI
MHDLRQEMWKKFFDFDPVDSPSNGNKNVDVSSDIKNKKVQSPSITDKAEPTCTSKSPVEEGVTQHFEKLEKCLNNHSSKEDSSKASKALNGPGPVSTPQNSSSSDRKATKIGLVDSQPITIDWDDPIETAYKMSSMNIQKNPTERKFLLGSDLEDVYKPIIEGLGGEVLNSPTFNISSTHIIVENPVRSEKLLCSLASGKWVLHVNYLHKCKEMEKWLPEEDFECGNPKSANNIPKFSGFSSLIANAAYKWRSTLGEGQGAYSGMKIAVMNFSTSKKKQYERLIVAGGGVVVSETCLNEATHCCLDPWIGSMPDFVKMFIKNNVPCVRPVFLGEYLYRHPKPSVRDHLLPILKDFYNDVNF